MKRRTRSACDGVVVHGLQVAIQSGDSPSTPLSPHSKTWRQPDAHGANHGWPAEAGTPGRLTGSAHARGWPERNGPDRGRCWAPRVGSPATAPSSAPGAWSALSSPRFRRVRRRSSACRRCRGAWRGRSARCIRSCFAAPSPRSDGSWRKAPRKCCSRARPRTRRPGPGRGPTPNPAPKLPTPGGCGAGPRRAKTGGPRLR